MFGFLYTSNVDKFEQKDALKLYIWVILSILHVEFDFFNMAAPS
jgi:hypothetical protein